MMSPSGNSSSAPRTIRKRNSSKPFGPARKLSTRTHPTSCGPNLSGRSSGHQQWPPGSTLQIADATIRGTLDLTDLALPALVLRHCKFDTLKLDDSHAPSIELQQRCTGQQISARRLASSGDLRVIEVQLIRDNRNRAASPGDREGERRDEADWRALDCYRLKAGGDVELQAVTVEEGRIDFSGADIKGRFTCSGSLSNPGQVALTCDGMGVGGSMYVGRRHDLLRPGTEMPGPPDITGGVRLVGAHISGEVNFTGLEIDNAGGTALDAEHAQPRQTLFIFGPTAASTMRTWSTSSPATASQSTAWLSSPLLPAGTSNCSAGAGTAPS
jgi:hypothetical protein